MKRLAFGFALVLGLMLSSGAHAQSYRLVGGSTIPMAISTVDTGGSSVTLSPGTCYRVNTTNAVYLAVNAPAVVPASTATPSFFLQAASPAEVIMFAPVTAASPVIHAITSAGTGTVYFTPMGGCQ